MGGGDRSIQNYYPGGGAATLQRVALHFPTKFNLVGIRRVLYSVQGTGDCNFEDCSEHAPCVVKRQKIYFFSELIRRGVIYYAGNFLPQITFIAFIMRVILYHVMWPDFFGGKKSLQKI